MNPQKIKELLQLAKIKKQRRDESERQVFSKAKYKETLEEFHEPVTENFKTDLEKFRANLRKLDDRFIKQREDFISRSDFESFQDMPPHSPDNSMLQLPAPQSESTPTKKYKYTADNLDEGLHITFLRERKLKLPSEIAVQPEALNQMLQKSVGISQQLGGMKSKEIRKLKKETDPDTIRDRDEKILVYNKSLDTLRNYREKLKVLKMGAEAFNIRGEGLLSELDRLTGTLIRGKPSKKLHNQIVDILNILRQKNIVTSENVQEYYKYFLH